MSKKVMVIKVNCMLSDDMKLRLRNEIVEKILSDGFIIVGDNMEVTFEEIDGIFWDKINEEGVEV